ncbi:MAG: aminoglycoside phosphotransferase family protein [Pseudomonadota bacterium]
MAQAFELRCIALLRSLDLARADEAIEILPLAGGVSSDIARVRVGDRSYCVKFALDRLRVAEEWYAPTRRNRSEYAWLEFASGIEPTAVPRLFGRSEAEGGFAMEFLSGPNVVLWKDTLLRGAPKLAEAVAVASTLGMIHAASAVGPFDRALFDNSEDFFTLRIEPYLVFTATHHPEVAAELLAVADRLNAASAALVHGDVSPKNIFFRGDRPILLDAECATMGDPGFDVSFCLNHLVLKAIHRPAVRTEILNSARGFWDAYAAHIDWEEPASLEARVCTLLPALMLARVDGKSPVEYLSPGNQDCVRRIAGPLIKRPSPDLAETLAKIAEAAS